MDRRTSIKWVLAAATALPLANAIGTPQPGGAVGGAKGYGTDPDLLRTYRPGELWPLTLNPPQRRTTATLCDLIIPADSHSPSASSVGVVDFIDEWISAPYPAHQVDRTIVVEGLRWLDEHSRQRFASAFAEIGATHQAAICDDICFLPRAAPQLTQAATFFARFRDLTAGGFYTTPHGRSDIGFVGNVPRATFDGPPLEVLRKAGLA
jgi:Gluconate 2-dehydrogenase subunit 3